MTHDFCVFAPLTRNAYQVACVVYKQARGRSKLLFMLTTYTARSNGFKEPAGVFMLNMGF